MVKKYTDKLFEFQWIDDFAAARNFSLECASNDMVLVLDSDEYLKTLDTEVLEQKIKDNMGKVGRIEMANRITREGQAYTVIDHKNRLFDKTVFCYSGRIHEQVVRRDKSKEGYETYISGVKVDHDGYEGTEAERKAKAMRNATILLSELKDNPNDPYILYQLGKSYYMATEFATAAEYFEAVLAIDVDPRLEYIVDMILSYGNTLLSLERYSDAMSLSGLYDTFGANSDFCFLLGLIYMNNGLFEKAIAMFQEARGKQNSKTVGTDSFLSWYNEGVILEVLGDTVGALNCYKAAGKYPLAEERAAVLLKKIK